MLVVAMANRIVMNVADAILQWKTDRKLNESALPTWDVWVRNTTRGLLDREPHDDTVVHSGWIESV